MLFVSMLRVKTGKAFDAIKASKHPNLPPGVKIIDAYGLFGKPDFLIIFEAPNEQIAAEFAVQFTNCADCTTSVVFPVDELKWTNI